VLGLATGTWTHKTHHGPDSGEATTFPHIVLSAVGRGGYIRMAHFVGTPEMESRKCPGWTSGTLNGHSSSLQTRIGASPNQSCSSRQELSNAVSHSSRRRREEVDSRLLVVGSQTASLTLGPSFAHNLGCRYPNCQCEAIFDIYISRPFQ